MNRVRLRSTARRAPAQYGDPVPLKADLTSADLDEIRQTVLGAADPLGVAAELAEAAAAGRLADPRDAGLALTLAAEIAESRTKLDAALRYADSALDAFGGRDDSPASTARAVRARILFRLGRAEEAMAELEPLRPRLNQDSDAPAYLSAALAVGGRYQVAEQWLTDAVGQALAERGGPEPTTVEDAGLLFLLLQQRHRVRHALGLQHDAHDNLAERLEARLADVNARTAAGAADLIFFPQPEFTRLIAAWPALAEAYGADFDEHRARLEAALVRRGDPALFRGSVAGLTSFAGDEDPSDEQVRAGYARQVATGSGRVPWPPERNGACWCGSGNKYKKCCLPRSRG